VEELFRSDGDDQGAVAAAPPGGEAHDVH
jgi:hypothetical protein